MNSVVKCDELDSGYLVTYRPCVPYWPCRDGVGHDLRFGGAVVNVSLQDTEDCLLSCCCGFWQCSIVSDHMPTCVQRFNMRDVWPFS